MYFYFIVCRNVRMDDKSALLYFESLEALFRISWIPYPLLVFPMILFFVFRFLLYTMKAAEEGLPEITSLLLDRDANVKARNRKGRDALSFAAAPSMKQESKDEHRYVIQLLIDGKADPRSKDNRGWTALYHAEKAGHEEIVECLTKLTDG